MRLWYLTHRRPAKARAPEPSLFARMKYGSQRDRPKIRHLAMDGCACARLKNAFTEDGKCHDLMTWLIYIVGTDEYGEFNPCCMYYDLWANGPKEAIEYTDYTYEKHFGKLLPSFAPRAAIRD